MARGAFYEIKDTPEQAANLTARSMLMIAIEQRIKEKGWTQAEAAERFHVTQPRVSDLLNGKINKFSLDALVNMLPAVGLRTSAGCRGAGSTGRAQQEGRCGLAKAASCCRHRQASSNCRGKQKGRAQLAHAPPTCDV
jgi:predicted XRE-type DNA-binding protein